MLDGLSADIRAVVDSREFAGRTTNLGIDAKGNTPSKLGAWMKQEMDKWSRIAAAANIRAE